MGKKKTKRKSHRLYAFVVLLLAAAILVLSVLVLFYVQQIKVEGMNIVRTSRSLIPYEATSIRSIPYISQANMPSGKERACPVWRASMSVCPRPGR